MKKTCLVHNGNVIRITNLEDQFKDYAADQKAIVEGQHEIRERLAAVICITHKARILANIYYWNKLYRLENSEKRFKNNVPENWALEIISKDELEMLNELAN